MSETTIDVVCEALAKLTEDCAAKQGTMIVDIEVRSDGTAHIHAVATWEKDDPPLVEVNTTPT